MHLSRTVNKKTAEIIAKKDGGARIIRGQVFYSSNFTEILDKNTEKYIWKY